MVAAERAACAVLFVALVLGVRGAKEVDHDRQKRFIPFIYPGGSVIQFALGLALPANVKGKNVATNSGILINIDLPTNLSQLQPPARSIRSTGGHLSLTNQLASLLGISEDGSKDCYAELECYRRQISTKNSFQAEIINAILLSMLLNVRICGFPIPWLEFSRTRKVFYSIYDVTVFIFCVYIIICSGYSIALRASFQDLCSLGIVCSQMSNGILITFHYLYFQKELREAILKMDSITERVMKSSLGHQDFFTNLYLRDRNIITIFTKASIIMNVSASILYVLPTPMIDYFMGKYRAHIPISMVHLGIPDLHRPIVFEIIIVKQVLILLYSSIKKVGNDCIFLSFFKMQTCYLKYLSEAMKTLGMKLVECGGEDREGKLLEWIHLHQDVLSMTHELVSLYAPIIVLYYTNLICIIAFGLFVQLRGDQVDMIQSVATALWIGTLIFVLFLQSAVADELREESDKVALETYFIPWYEMKKDVTRKVPLIMMLANHPIHLTAYRAVSFILNKETFLGFIVSVITVYMGFSKIDEKVG